LDEFRREFRNILALDRSFCIAPIWRVQLAILTCGRGALARLGEQSSPAQPGAAGPTRVLPAQQWRLRAAPPEPYNHKIQTALPTSLEEPRFCRGDGAGAGRLN